MTDGVGGITSTANPVQILGKDKNLTEAIRLAGQHKGSEIVVGYVDKSKPGGEHAPIQYAVIDVGPALTAGKGSKTAKTAFDPSTLNFGDGTQIVSAIVVTDQKDGKVDRNYLGDLKFLDGVDPSIQTDTVLALAEAACSRVGDPSKNKQIEGFNPAKTNTDWVKMVHENRGTVLRQVSVTLDTLDTTIKSKENALATAIKEGRTDDAEALKKELTDLRGQRDELATYQGIIRVDLLTDPRGAGVVPGMQAKDGTLMHAGDWRNMVGAKKAINLLVEEKAVLQGKLQSTTDPEQKGRLERQIAALDDAIQGITFKTADSLRSQGLINSRMMALGTICKDVSAATRDLKIMQGNLKDGKVVNPSAYKVKADELRQGLINTFRAQMQEYKKAGGADKAVEFLALQIRELEQLPAGNVDGLLDQIDRAQAGLLKQISAMADKIEDVMPSEAKAMRAIAEGVDDFDTAYTTLATAATNYENFARKLGETAGSQGFRLSQAVLTGLGDAMKWDPIKGGRSPFQTNQFIVGQYVETSKEIRAYVGSDTPDWYAVGAKACNQVGGEIAKLMTVETCLATFGLSDGTIANDLRAAKALLAIIDGDSLGQGGAVAMALGSDFIDALRKAVSSGSIGPLSKFTDKLPGLSEAVSELRKGFVEGNVRIAQNVLTARKVFFEAEFAGENGVAALKTYAKTHPNFDPEGYMVSAYTCIQQAKAKNESGDKAGADKLMLKANAFIAMQEQSTFLQTKNTFGNKSMRLVLDHAGSSSSLSLEKPDGSGTIKYKLVDNWTKLHVRMGMDYVSKDAYEKNAKSSTDGALYFKLTIKPDQRLEVEPGMNLKPEDTFKDDQGRPCVKPGVTVYMKLPENAPMGTAGRLFIEANKDGDIEKSMLVRPEAPPGPGYTYDANDGLVDLAGDMLESAWDFISADVAEVFEGSDKDVTKKKPESLTVNGGTTKTESSGTGKQPVTTGST